MFSVPQSSSIRFELGSTARKVCWPVHAPAVFGLRAGVWVAGVWKTATVDADLSQRAPVSCNMLQISALMKSRTCMVQMSFASHATGVGRCRLCCSYASWRHVGEQNFGTRLRPLILILDLHRAQRLLLGRCCEGWCQGEVITRYPSTSSSLM